MRTLSKAANAFDEGRLTLGACVWYRSVHLKKGHLTSGLEDEQLAMPTGGREHSRRGNCVNKGLGRELAPKV